MAEQDDGLSNEELRALVASLKAEKATKDAEIRRLRKLAEPTPKRRRRSIIVHDSPSEKQLEKLGQMQEGPDKYLQRVLWQLDCKFDIYKYKHQFEGIRALAGVAKDFPGTLLDVNALRKAKPRVDGQDRGIILADEMGLGKTVQAVAAIVLRNAIAAANNRPTKPSLVCLPNEAVLFQWKEHLQQGGILGKKIIRFKPKDPYPLAEDAIYLCTRYDFQTEMKYILDSLPKKNDLRNRRLRRSVLFPHASEHLLQVLKNQQQNSSGKARNKFNVINGQKHTISEIVTHYLALEEGVMTDDCVFRTLIIDEAHFLKSLKTFWSMCAGLVSLHSERVIPMTGTPYNNSCEDLATLMAFIQASHMASGKKWWDQVTSEQRTAGSVRAKLETWASQYILRREKDVIKSELPNKICRKEKIMELNLTVYEVYEAKILTALKQIFKLKGLDGDSKALNDALRRMLAMASCMQQALIHEMLPGGGRQLSVLFSPSLCSNKSVKKSLEKKNFCVQCGRRVEITFNRSRPVAHDLDGFNDVDENGAEDDFFTYEDIPTRPSNEEKGSGDIISIPAGLCRFTAKGINHFACQTCLDKLKREKKTCRMCEKLLSRLCRGVERKSVIAKEDSPSEEDGNQNECARIHGADVFGGFRPSMRLQTILSNFKTKVPRDDKVIILSFFKGSLDLLERMFHDAGINAARYDGDVNVIQRQNVLGNFKENESSRVLLMTVQTGGTGLNIVEANHVWFVDRHWNPMVMKQAEDRCFRLKQKKPVYVSNHDTPMTFDDVMCYINEAKSTNAAIVLSDNLAFKNTQVSYKDMSGFLGEAISRIRGARRAGQTNTAEEVMTNVLATLPPDQSRPLGYHSQESLADVAMPFRRHPISEPDNRWVGLTATAIDLTSDDDDNASGVRTLSVAGAATLPERLSPGISRWSMKGPSPQTIHVDLTFDEDPSHWPQTFPLEEGTKESSMATTDDDDDEVLLTCDKEIFDNGFFVAAKLPDTAGRVSTNQPSG